MTNDINLKRVLRKETTKVKHLLRPTQSSFVYDRNIIARYVAAIMPNFVPWVAATSVSAKSLQARFAAQENLYEEIEGNHQEMLMNFADSARAFPGKNDFERVMGEVYDIRRIVSRMNGIQNTALCAYLENTSAAFIPYLEKLALQRGSGNITYTQTHGEADVEHAKQFVWALQHEIDHNNGNIQGISEVFRAGYHLMKSIFNPNSKRAWER